MYPSKYYERTSCLDPREAWNNLDKDPFSKMMNVVDEIHNACNPEMASKRGHDPLDVEFKNNAPLPPLVLFTTMNKLINHQHPS